MPVANEHTVEPFAARAFVSRVMTALLVAVCCALLMLVGLVAPVAPGLPVPSPAIARAATYADVPADAWYAQGGYIDYVSERGIMTGLTDGAGNPTGLFLPEGQITRGEVATVLFRIANPDSSVTTDPACFATSSHFSDVPAPFYYTASVEWCYQSGIVTGYTDAAGVETGCFGPDDLVTREQLATMLARFAGTVLGVDVSARAATGAGAQVTAMPDWGQVDAYAQTAMAWAFAEGILTGWVAPDGRAYLMPLGNATRAQAAKMLTVMLQGAHWGEEEPAYAVLYNDGELVFRRGDPAADADAAGSPRQAIRVYTDFETARYTDGALPPWCADASAIKRVVVEEAVHPVSLDFWFFNLASCTSFDLGLLDASRATSMVGTFFGCSSVGTLDLSGWDVSGVITLYSAFTGCTSLTQIDLTGWNPRSCVDFSCMFFKDGRLTSLDLSGWDTAAAVDLTSMFQSCTALTTLNLAGWDVSNVASLMDTFSSCSSLRSLDLAGWSPSSAVSLMNTFLHCSSLASLDLTGWDVASARTAARMFAGCTALTTLNLAGWDVAGLEDASLMFSECSSLTSLNLAGWAPMSLRDVRYMFYRCSSLTMLDFSGWDTAGAAPASDAMMRDCARLAEVAVGERFTLVAELPAPGASAAAQADGLWHAADGSSYAPADIPVGVAATYRAAAWAEAAGMAGTTEAVGAVDAAGAAEAVGAVEEAPTENACLVEGEGVEPDAIAGLGTGPNEGADEEGDAQTISVEQSSDCAPTEAGRLLFDADARGDGPVQSED